MALTSLPGGVCVVQRRADFCDAFTRQERKAGRIDDSLRYRLPTVGEWELACRGGMAGRYGHGDDVARLSEFACTAKKERIHWITIAQRVASKRPNAWGLFDMHGNVSEWCRADGETEQPHRGGSFQYPADQVTATSVPIRTNREVPRLGIPRCAREVRLSPSLPSGLPDVFL